MPALSNVFVCWLHKQVSHQRTDVIDKLFNLFEMHTATHKSGLCHLWLVNNQKLDCLNLCGNINNEHAMLDCLYRYFLCVYHNNKLCNKFITQEYLMLSVCHLYNMV